MVSVGYGVGAFVPVQGEPLLVTWVREDCPGPGEPSSSCASLSLPPTPALGVIHPSLSTSGASVAPSWAERVSLFPSHLPLYLGFLPPHALPLPPSFPLSPSDTLFPRPNLDSASHVPSALSPLLSDRVFKTRGACQVVGNISFFII